MGFGGGRATLADGGAVDASDAPFPPPTALRKAARLIAIGRYRRQQRPLLPHSPVAARSGTRKRRTRRSRGAPSHWQRSARGSNVRGPTPHEPRQRRRRGGAGRRHRKAARFVAIILPVSKGIKSVVPKVDVSAGGAPRHRLNHSWAPLASGDQVPLKFAAPLPKRRTPFQEDFSWPSRGCRRGRHQLPLRRRLGHGRRGRPRPSRRARNMDGCLR